MNYVILYLVLLGEEALKMHLPLADPVSIGRPAPRPAPRTVLGQHLAQLLKINIAYTALLYVKIITIITFLVFYLTTLSLKLL
jgi:hypothetical protein